MWLLWINYEIIYFQFQYSTSFPAFSVITLPVWSFIFAHWKISLSHSNIWSKVKLISHLYSRLYIWWYSVLVHAWHQSKGSSEGSNFTLKGLKVKEKALRLTESLVFLWTWFQFLKSLVAGHKESQHLFEHKRTHSAPWIHKNKTYSFHRWTFHSPVSQ